MTTKKHTFPTMRDNETVSFKATKKPKWVVKQILRENGLIEDVCKHGIGHPNRESVRRRNIEGDDIHGCDGCCVRLPNGKHDWDKLVQEAKEQEKQRKTKGATKEEFGTASTNVGKTEKSSTAPANSQMCKTCGHDNLHVRMAGHKGEHCTREGCECAKPDYPEPHPANSNEKYKMEITEKDLESGHLPSCGKVASEAEVAAWKVFLKRHKEKSPELWPFLSNEIKNLMMDCYLEGKAEAKASAGSACSEPAPVIVSPSLPQGKGGLKAAKSDFEAALKDKMFEYFLGNKYIDFRVVANDMARWAREYTFNHEVKDVHDKEELLLDAYKLGAKLTRAQIRKLWKESLSEAVKEFEEATKAEQKELDIDEMRGIIFSRKLKELGV